MKRIAGVIAVVVLVVWAKVHFSSKPSDPTMEQMAEKVGREARERMARQNQPAPGGLQIKETSTAAEPAPAPPEPATSQAPSHDDTARARVSGMLKALQSKQLNEALTYWAGGSIPDAAARFKTFLSAHAIPEKIDTIEIVNTNYMDVSEVTTVDVSVNGAVYHMGVPDAGPIFWPF